MKTVSRQGWIGKIALCILLSALCPYAEAQQQKDIPRIGYLTDVGSAPAETFVQGLRDLDYVG